MTAGANPNVPSPAGEAGVRSALAIVIKIAVVFLLVPLLISLAARFFL